MNLNQAAQQFRAAQASYQAAFRAYFDELAPLADPQFWQLQPIFTEEVCRFRFRYGRTQGVEQAAEELFRRPLAAACGAGNENRCDYSLEDATRFAKAWEGLRRRLYRPLFDIIEDRSDDGYGDLLDALPLAGAGVVEAALQGALANHQQFEHAVREACQRCPQLANLILEGENYVGMHLYDAAQQAFALQVML